MQERLPCPDQELICINVDKVYDWVMKENSFDFFPTAPMAFPGMTPTTPMTGATVTCEVTPATTNPVVILRRENRQFTVDGHSVCLQQLTIQKTFSVVLVLTLPTGVIFRSSPIPVSRSEQVILCAPEGTDVTVTFTELDCFISAPGTPVPGDGVVTFTGLVVSVMTCQSIQSTFPVTVEFLADFCEPRADLAIGSCPHPARPRQCPAVYPD
ncbi:hypothetical protein QTL97_17970 [Sporosarcina thermotolerans]|uniref:Uncharacterized protein n=1 Tax=Sporosarcina thermotolerans TaxID=633404 RepID=A0AAW9AEP1_9BACL|nr:hypothetical protein [Sporosarcina thermotolerans]MDW0118815.1 hypothetical protein [Sporosarcina thermotolerans]WHT48505.1 hypothetical protein QNH10_01290 [Sporosarcina thermotolerans]